jgi:hypothetical protein
MFVRIETLVQRTQIITASEYTPFIWDTEYSYDAYFTIKEFNTLIEGKEAEYLYADEYEYRELFYYNDNVIFDTNVMRLNNWRLFYRGKILPGDQFNIYGFEDNVLIEVFIDNE